MLTEPEIQQRIKLGLITLDPPSDQPLNQPHQDHDEIWEEFDETSDDDLVEPYESTSEDDCPQFVIDTRRTSTVDPSLTHASPPGTSHSNHEKQFHFSNTKHNTNKTPCRLSVLNEAEEHDQLEENDDSTVNGDDDMEGVDFEDTSSHTNKENIDTQNKCALNLKKGAKKHANV